MNLDLTTFILELLNFAVLVWILNRFLFRPVMAVMDQRRAAIEAEQAQAQKLRDEADTLRAQYEGRVAEWQKEKEKKRAELQKELAVERDKALGAARDVALKEQQKIAAAEEKKREAAEKTIERRAMMQGAAFAAKMLHRLSGPELDAKLVELLLEDVRGWPKAKVKTLAAALKESGGAVQVVSARGLSVSVKKALEHGLSDLLAAPCKGEYAIDGALLSGLRVEVGPWALRADLGDELEFFVENGTEV